MTVNDQIDEAIDVYLEVLDARDGNFGDEPVKDIYRKMAPLYQAKENYTQAASCLKKVFEEETQDLAKVGLLTKIAGNFKRANKESECVEASEQAYSLMKKVSGEQDIQTAKCLLNYASVYLYFEKSEEALKLYKQFEEQFKSMNGENGTTDWSKDTAFVNLAELARQQIKKLEGGEEEEGEYYDEEEEGEAEEAEVEEG